MSNENIKYGQKEENRINDPIYTAGIGSRISDAAKGVGGIRRLAEMINMSEAQLYRITSEKSLAKVETIAAIAVATGVPVGWLAIGEESANQTNKDVAHKQPEIGTLDNLADLGRKFADALIARPKEEQKAILTALWGTPVATSIVGEELPEIKRHIAGSVKRPRRGEPAKTRKIISD